MSRVAIEFPQTVHFTHQLPVRVYDLNYGQHLGHDRLISLLHEARCAWFASRGHSELDIGGAGIVLADLQVSYQGEAFYGDLLTIEIAAGERSSKGAALYYRVTNQQGKSIALAKTGMVFFDFSTRRPIALPQAFLGLLAS